jgi:hypothetical protein
VTAAAKVTTVRPMPLLIKTVQTLYAKAIQADDKATGLWISLGIELKEAKARNKEMDGVPWPEFAKLHFDLGQSRADELIRIADGRTNVDEVRASGAARVQKTRAGSALRNAGFPDAEQVERDRKTCIALYQKAIAADPEFAQWMAEPDDDDDEPDEVAEPPTAVPEEHATRVQQVNDFIGEVQDFAIGLERRLTPWIEENKDVGDEAKRWFIMALQRAANIHLELAQTLDGR